MKISGIFVLLGAMLLCMASCKPDKPIGPTGPSAPVDGRQKFVGVYDVYDTIGNWRYDMEIVLHHGVSHFDSLYVIGWGDEFDVYIQHDKENESNFLNFIGGFGIADHDGNRWVLFREYDTLFNNTLVNDTLRLSYLKDNIAAWSNPSVDGLVHLIVQSPDTPDKSAPIKLIAISMNGRIVTEIAALPGQVQELVLPGSGVYMVRAVDATQRTLGLVKVVVL